MRTSVEIVGAERSLFEKERGVTRYTEAWARSLAMETAQALCRDYCVVMGHPVENQYDSYSRYYVENRLYCGEIGHSQVVACYGADGQEIPREEVSDKRR